MLELNLVGVRLMSKLSLESKFFEDFRKTKCTLCGWHYGLCCVYIMVYTQPYTPSHGGGPTCNKILVGLSPCEKGVYTALS